MRLQHMCSSFRVLSGLLLLSLTSGAFSPTFRPVEARAHWPYVAHLPNGTDLYLVLPFRQWDEK